MKCSIVRHSSSSLAADSNLKAPEKAPNQSKSDYLQLKAEEKPRFTGLLESPLTDSNR